MADIHHHHIDENGEVVRTPEQKKLLEQVKYEPIDRTKKGDESGRLRARKLREQASFITNEESHQKARQAREADEYAAIPEFPSTEAAEEAIEAPPETQPEGETSGG